MDNENHDMAGARAAIKGYSTCLRWLLLYARGWIYKYKYMYQYKQDELQEARGNLGQAVSGMVGRLINVSLDPFTNNTGNCVTTYVYYDPSNMMLQRCARPFRHY